MTAASATGFGMAPLLGMEPLVATPTTVAAVADAAEQVAAQGVLDAEGSTSIAVQALAPRRDSVKTARDFTQHTLAQWDACDLSDDLALVVSELVTNALCHGLDAAECPLIPAPAAPEEGADDSVQLALLRRGGKVMCAVQDPGELLPVARESDDSAETGRGLHIVECFSRAWGSFPLSGGGDRAGKVVWAVFDIPTAM